MEAGERHAAADSVHPGGGQQEGTGAQVHNRKGEYT